jgi:methylated-DNA-[protein]-cysteine S-methyltransferase
MTRPDRIITETLCSVVIETPVGALRLVADPSALVGVLWESERPGRVRLGMVPEAVEASNHQVLGDAAGQLAEYFAGTRRGFDLPLAPVGTVFQVAAWQALGKIPFGSTWSYRRQAEFLGDGRLARAVGAANGRNPLSILVPCHRVVGSNGRLTGYAGGVSAKAWLLEHEAQ